MELVLTRKLESIQHDFLKEFSLNQSLTTDERCQDYAAAMNTTHYDTIL